MNKVALLGACVVVFAVGCRRDEPVPGPTTPAAAMVRLTVAPMWNSVPFDKNTIYQNISDERIQLQLLKLYLGDVSLFTEDGDSAEVFDVDFFKLTDGAVSRTYAVAEGTYGNVRVGLGVPADLNGMNPAMWSNEEPLSITNGMYWTWTTMYRFVIFDGRYDTVATNTGTPPYQLSIHTGRNECYRNRSFVLPVTVTAGDTADLRLEFDIARFFYSPTDTLYMATESQQHGSIEELPMSEKFSDMVMASMNLELVP
mgnify:FL=1